MKCARCGAALDDGVMVCSQCGAVVGMTYAPRGPSPVKTAPAPAAKPAMVRPAAAIAPTAPRTGTTKGLVERAKAILLSPRAEWKVIAAEPVRAYDLWLAYIVPLALIGPAALAIAQVVIGTSFPMVGIVKAAAAAGVAAALLTFAFSLVQVAVIAWAVQAMAKKFEAAPDPLAALQVVAYSLTPVWLAGLLYLVPPLQFLWLFAVAYAVLLCLFGLRTLMRCPPQHALTYVGATAGIALLVWVITGTIVTALIGFGPMMFD